MSELFQLAYISRSSIAGSPEEIEKQVNAILHQSQTNNKSHDITGALLYSGGYFCQVIEGPEDEVLARFKTIQTDSRHKNVKILHYHQIDERGFSEWAMAYAGIDDSLRPNIDDIKDSTDEIKIKATGKVLVQTLDKLLNRHQLRSAEQTS